VSDRSDDGAYYFCAFTDDTGSWLEAHEFHTPPYGITSVNSFVHICSIVPLSDMHLYN
jgi:hypothetical protein